MPLVIFLMSACTSFIAQAENAPAPDNNLPLASNVAEEKSRFQIEPYKNNYVIFSTNRGSEGCDAKLQLSFLANLKSGQWRRFPFTSANPVDIAVNFNYTQVFFDDLCASSSPIVTSDYMPGVFISIGRQTPVSGFGFRPFKLGWEHQSNGEFEGESNRGWDRLFMETLLGYNQKNNAFYSNVNSIRDSTKRSDRYRGFPGVDKFNARLRWSFYQKVSDDNADIEDFYGLIDAEFTYSTHITQTSLSLSRGREKGWTQLEFTTKFVPGLGHLNRQILKANLCKRNNQRTGGRRLWDAVACVVRPLFSMFDLVDNNGAWMLQYFDGYGERIRDYNLRTDGALRIGFRYS
jgi:outer membrane phospholipase A